MPTTEAVACPKCGGPTWDNRLTKRNPKAPDYKCKDATCDGAVWPPKGNGTAPRAAAAPVKQGYSSGGPLPGEEAAAGFGPDAMPHERLDHLFRVYSLVESHVLATSVPKFTKADVGTTPESVAAQIHTLFIAATKAGV